MPGKPHRGRSLPTASDVLAGRVQVDEDTLIALIRAANPTGKVLTADERDRRYLRKGRLQSLLVCRFPASLRLCQEPGREHLVLLQQRRTGRSAGHVPIDTLEPDARAWVRQQIDEGNVEIQAPPVLARAVNARSITTSAPRMKTRASLSQPEPSGDPLLLGERALAAFDYEAARAAFRRALREAPLDRRPKAARALLSLLVDTLGDDSGALTEAQRLPEEAYADAEVRSLLALSAARAGRPDRAAALIAGLACRRAVQVHLLLSDAALAAGDLADAEEALRRAQAIDPAEPGITDRTEGLRRARAAARGPLEEALRGLLSQGALDEAAAAARDVLARFPDSEAADRALSSIDSRRRLAAAEALLEEGAQALLRGEPAAAIGPLQAALQKVRGGALRERILGLLGEAEAVLLAAKAQVQREEVRHKLAARDRTAGLLSYLGLPVLQARAVRDGLSQPEQLRLVHWLDEMRRARNDAPARALADAALALAEAVALADPEAALSLLKPHERVLGCLPIYQQIATKERAQRQQRRLSDAQERLSVVRRGQGATSAEELFRAQALLGSIELHLLDDEEQKEARRIQGALAARRERLDLEVRMHHLRSSGDLLGARALAERLGAEKESQDGKEAHFRTAAAELSAAIRRSFCVRSALGLGDQPDIDTMRCGATEWYTGRWLLPGRDQVLIQFVRGPMLFMFMIDFGGRVQMRLRLRAPEHILLNAAEIDGEHLWVFGHNGLILQIRLSDFDVRCCHRGGEVLRKGEVAGSGQLAGGSRFLWLGLPIGRDSQEVRVIDVARPRSVLRLGEATFVHPLTNSDEEDLVLFAGPASSDVLIYGPSGRLRRRLPLPERARLRAAAPHPGGSGILLLLAHLDRDDALSLVAVDEIGAMGLFIPIADAMNGPCQMATDGDAGLAFVHVRTRADTDELLALRGADLEHAYRVPVPESTALVRDATAGRVALAHTVADGIHIARLGGAPPELPQEVRRTGLSLFSTHACWRPLPLSDKNPIIRAALIANVAARHQALLRHADPEYADPAHLVEVESALSHHGRREAEACARAALVAHPRHGGLRLIVAHYEAQKEHWPEVRRLLSMGGASEAGPPSRVRHFHHLLGIALLKTGAAAEAQAVLAAGLPHEGGCGLEAPHQLALGLCESAEETADDPSLHPARRIVRALRASDALLDRGDAAGAAAAMDRPFIWNEEEVQCMARLCEAWLALPTEDEMTRFHKAMVLATFLFVHREESPRNELPLFPRWDRGRLDEIGQRAEAWLLADGADQEKAEEVATEPPGPSSQV